ncbi:MAG: IS630 family transposase [Gammaproteobacteria bacterium]
MARPLLIPNPENATIEELKQVSRVGSNETATRCTAIQMLLVGANRDLVCNALLVTNRAIRKWINRFNRCGVDGLIVKKRPGRMTIINDQQAWQLTNLIDQPQQAQRTFWTAKAFHGYISKEYQIQCSYETVVRFFHKQGYAFPRKRWDKKGRKTRVTKNGGHLRMNVIGMVCPRSGQFFAIEASHSDSATFQAFLDEANKTVLFQRTTNILIVDNATWHRRKDTHWHSWQPKYLPPYSPDLNPIERIWLTMKARWFNNYVCKNEEQLLERLDQASTSCAAETIRASHQEI